MFGHLKAGWRKLLCIQYKVRGRLYLAGGLYYLCVKGFYWAYFQETSWVINGHSSNLYIISCIADIKEYNCYASRETVVWMIRRAPVLQVLSLHTILFFLLNKSKLLQYLDCMDSFLDDEWPSEVSDWESGTIVKQLNTILHTISTLMDVNAVTWNEITHKTNLSARLQMAHKKTLFALMRQEWSCLTVVEDEHIYQNRMNKP